MKNYLLQTFTACIFIFTSCRDEYSICNLSKDVRFIAGFYQRNNGADVLAPAPLLTLTQLGANSPIYSLQPNVASFSTALNPLTDSVKYYIKIANNLLADTVTIVYSSTGVNLSPECGGVIYHNIARLYSTANTIDSVKIFDPTLNTNLLLNAKIYY